MPGTAMLITIQRIIPFEWAIRAFRKTPFEETEGGAASVPDAATIRIADLHPNEANPSSLYLIRDRLERTRALYDAFLNQRGVNIFQLPWVVWYTIDDVLYRMAPPFVEISREPAQLVARPVENQAPPPIILNIPLIVDGIHRVFCAWQDDELIRCIVGTNLHPRPECLNYAWPNSWDQVLVYDEVPPSDRKKLYRGDMCTCFRSRHCVTVMVR